MFRTPRVISLVVLLSAATLIPHARAQENCNGQPVTVFGTEGDDTLTGTPGDDVIQALGGNDTIEGLGGDDNLCGGAGNDTLLGGGGSDGLIGETGMDSLSGDDGRDFLEGGAEADTIDGGDGIDDLSYAGSPAGVNVDLSTGQASGGDAGGDQFVGVEDIDGSYSDDVMTGDEGPNFLYARDGDDVLTAAGGDDVFDAGPGADSIAGGEGFDAVDYSYQPDSTEGITIDLTTGTGAGGNAEGDMLSSIESVGGTPYGDTLLGSAGDDALYGNAGNDTLVGMAGNDYLTGEMGNDHEDGGDGTDYFRQLDVPDGSDEIIGGAGDDDQLDYYARGGRAVAVSTDGVANDGEKGERDNIGADLEILGGANGPDDFVGSGGPDDFRTRGGNDVASGLGGSDALVGGGGNDKLMGGGGGDRLVAGSGKDVLNGGPGEDTCVVNDRSDVTRSCEHLRRHF